MRCARMGSAEVFALAFRVGGIAVFLIRVLRPRGECAATRLLSEYPFSDCPDDGIDVLSYCFEAVFAEKIRAFAERKHRLFYVHL